MRPRDLGVGGVDGGGEDGEIEEEGEPLGVADEVDAQQVEEDHRALPVLGVGEELEMGTGCKSEVILNL